MRKIEQRLLAATWVGCLLVPAGVAFAADQTDTQEVVVTGTRVPGRTKLDTVAPVDVITATALEHNGSTELAETLSTSLPSLNFPRPSLTDGTDSVRPVTLRGLAPDQTLVLVDSKRRQSSALVNLNGTVGRGSSAVDLNTIPVDAIGTIEVLRDGASAQYGSDAIAGVVNIRLREASSGGGATVTSGFYDTDINTTPQAAPAGAPWSSPANRHVTDGYTTTGSAWSGFALGQTGFLTLSTEIKSQDHTVRAGPDLRPQYALVNGGYDPREGSINRIGDWFGDPDLKQYTFFANAGYDIGDVHLYGWADYQYRNTVSGGAFRRPCTATTLCYNSLTSSSTNSSIQDISAIYPNGFLPKIAPVVQDSSAALGATFKLDGWDLDSSVVWGKNSLHYYVIDSLNVTLGPTSQNQFDAGELSYSQTVFDFGAVKSFPTSFTAEPINVAVGTEYRREEYQIMAGEPASYVTAPNYPSVTALGKTVPSAAGAQVFPGFTPANAADSTRGSYAGYLDVDVRPITDLDVDAAMRGEYYAGFGGVITGKFAARYDFTNNFALRGAVSDGFRAPSLQQTTFTSTTTTFINGIPYQIVTAPPASAAVQPLGSQPLQPEKSTNYSGGAVVRWNDLTFTLDGYKIDIKNRIVLSENLTAANVVALLPAGISGVRFFTNGVDTSTTGEEAVLTYVYRPGGEWGRFDFTLSGTHNQTSVTKLPSTNVLSTLNPAPILFGRVNTLIFEDGQPHNKATFATEWNGDMFGATARATYYGNVLVPGTTANLDYNLGSHTLVDLEARMFPLSKLEVAIGVNNLLDSYPVAAPNSTGGAFSSYSPFGFDGRFFYGRLAYRW